MRKFLFFFSKSPGKSNVPAGVALSPEADQDLFPEKFQQQFFEKVLNGPISSFLRMQESSLFKAFWTPAFAGATTIRSISASC
jgi:hypothetical protein